MKNILPVCLSAIALAAFSTNATAQDSGYHPILSDNFLLSMGVFNSNNAFTLSAEGGGFDGTDIDFDEHIGVDNNDTIFNGQLRWKFGSERKWSVALQYFSNDATGNATLEEDIEWQDTIFREGSFVEGGVKTTVERLFLGRSFYKRPQHDFGIGIGLHNLDLSAFIGGEILVDEETTGYQRADASISQILPNAGTWYLFSPSKRWLLHARVDWISASIDEYSGSMWNVNAGVNFQAFKHVGIDLAYQYFNLDLEVDGSNWRGGADMTYSGPMVAVTVNW